MPPLHLCLLKSTIMIPPFIWLLCKNTKLFNRKCTWLLYLTLTLLPSLLSTPVVLPALLGKGNVLCRCDGRRHVSKTLVSEGVGVMTECVTVRAIIQDGGGSSGQMCGDFHLPPICSRTRWGWNDGSVPTWLSFIFFHEIDKFSLNFNIFIWELSLQYRVPKTELCIFLCQVLVHCYKETI